MTIDNRNATLYKPVPQNAHSTRTHTHIRSIKTPCHRSRCLVSFRRANRTVVQSSMLSRSITNF